VEGEVGGVELNEAQPLRQLKEEYRKLKRLVTDLRVDKELLRAVIAQDGWRFPDGWVATDEECAC